MFSSCVSFFVTKQQQNVFKYNNSNKAFLNVLQSFVIFTKTNKLVFNFLSKPIAPLQTFSKRKDTIVNNVGDKEKERTTACVPHLFLLCFIRPSAGSQRPIKFFNKPQRFLNKCSRRCNSLRRCQRRLSRNPFGTRVVHQTIVASTKKFHCVVVETIIAEPA